MSPWGAGEETLKAGMVVPISILKDDLSDPEAIKLIYQGVATYITQEDLEKLGPLTRQGTSSEETEQEEPAPPCAAIIKLN